MDPALDTILRFGSIAVAGAAFGWSVLQYRLGARKAELDAVNRRIDGVAKTVGDVAGELQEHKEAGQSSRAELAGRLGNVEAALQHLPDKDSVHRLDLAVTEIRGKIDTQGETLKAVGATASRVEEFLLTGARSAR